MIPGPAADAALRDAMGKVQGRLLVGVINSIGVRRDVQAVNGLAEKLKDADVNVASAAAVALGCIGGDEAAGVLQQALADASAAVRPAVAEGCVRCAEKYLAQEKSAQAKKLYDAVCTADVPKQRILDATRGAILARGSAGVPFLVEQLTSADKGRVGIGLRTARELPGEDVTKALAAAMDKLNPDRQPLLLLALSDRKDTAVLPVVVKVRPERLDQLRTTAVGVLVRVGNVSCVPVLLEAAVQDDTELAQAAKITLAKLPGKDVDDDLVGPLAAGDGQDSPSSDRDWRDIGCSMAALPAIVQSLEDSDAGVRTAAVQAIGVLGGTEQVADLVKLAEKTKERGDIEKALQAVGESLGR